MAPPPPATERIGRFRIEAVIGRGAMGVVFRAHDPDIDRKVAIKLVRADLLDGDERAEYVARFRREAQAAGRCVHPNIVAVHDFALHDGNPYLAMEFVDGVSLQQRRAPPGGFSAAEIVSIGGQVLDGLAAAHALGVVHRDIKPANIMLAAPGPATGGAAFGVKITDFGVSRLDSSVLTGSGGVVGTPSYMSPEQCRGDAVDARSDLFSVAIVLHELVTGARPFAGASQHEVWHRLLHEDPPDSAALRPDVPAALHAVLRRALGKHPADRFQTAGAMAAALRAGLPAGQGASGDAPPPPAPDPDRTVVQPQGGQPQGGQAPGDHAQGGLDLDSAAMTTIERRLARHVGPIAGHLVRSAVRKAGTVDTFTDALAASVPVGDGREALRAELRREVSASHTRSGIGRGGSGGAAPLPEAELARAQAELARHVGPIARLLVRRAAPGCSDVAQLWLRLAGNIEGPERARFLAKGGATPPG